LEKKLVEIKAAYDNLDKARAVLEKLEAKFLGSFKQVDTYFNVKRGRLKLREVEGARAAQLIYYQRQNLKGPKESDVVIVETPDANEMKDIMDAVFGIKVVVEKRRDVYIYKGVRIHLDEVRDLGTFVEFEKETTSEDIERDRKLLRDLMRALGIVEEDLIRESYSDLLLERSASPG